MPAALAIFAALAIPQPAAAMQLGGALSWSYGRTEVNTPSSNSVRTEFQQVYRFNLSGNVLRRELGMWTFGAGLRDTKSDDHGTGGGARANNYRTTDLNFGLTLFPTRVPMNLTLTRSITDNGNGRPVDRSALGTSVDFNTRVPMPDGNPLGVSLRQTSQTVDSAATGIGRMASLDKRFDLGSATRLQSAYRFSQFRAAGSETSAHGLSLSSATDWSERISSNLYANRTTRDSTSTRIAGGRSIFLSNNYGGLVNYRNKAISSGSLAYDFSEIPQEQTDPLTSQQMYGRGTRRLGTRTDVNGSVAVRRLDIQSSQLDTGSASMGVVHRPRLGWSTGLNLGVAQNVTRNSLGQEHRFGAYNSGAFFTARHEFQPLTFGWGVTTGYVVSSGGTASDRLTDTLNLTLADHTVDWVRLTSFYQFTDIREAPPGHGMSPYTQEHYLTLNGNFQPRTALLLPSDVLSGDFSMTQSRSRLFWTQQDISTSIFTLDGTYRFWSGLEARSGYSIARSSEDMQGAHQEAHSTLAWNGTAFLRGTQRLEGNARRTWAGGGYQVQEAGLAYELGYSIGLLRASLNADTTFRNEGSFYGRDNVNNVRLNVTRSF
ncbi:MAG: hypothetical protein OEW11_08540 [Nitrospirota bacterium]|nr:hypothetical protein [Nitrospirota bacterium]